MNRTVAETLMGAVVLVVAAVFVYFVYSTSQVRSVQGGYEVTARFSNVEGISTGGDVRMAGIKIGTVSSMTLDPKTYLAVVKMEIDPSIKLSKDTAAAVSSAGLLGDKFMGLTPGNDDALIPPGGVITSTQSSMNIESLIGQYIYGSTNKSGSTGSSSTPASSPAPGK